MKNINRYVLFVLAILLVGGVVYYLSDIVAYILIAWVLSMLGQPVMRFFRRLKIGKLKMGPNVPMCLNSSLFCSKLIGLKFF